MDWKKPSGTICLVVVVLLIFILSCGAIMFSQISNLTEPLEGGNYTIGQKTFESTYAEFEIIEQGPEYTIIRDAQTDVLYMEFKRNGYSSALTVLVNADGTPKTYSQFVGG